MFESSLLVDPAEVFPDLVAAIDAVPVRAARGGTAAQCDLQVRSLLALARRLEGLLLAAVSAFDDQGFAPALGASSTGSYLTAHGHLDPAGARRLVLAARTADRMPQLAAMLAAGDIGLEHVAAVGFATRRVPSEVLAAQDPTFASLAASARPAELRVAGKQLQAMYDTDAASRDATHVRDSRHLSLAPTFHDAWHLEGLLTPEDGTSLAVALESLMGRRGEQDLRTVTQRRADALIELAELAELALRSARLPDCGGDRPRVTLLVQAGRNPFTHHHHRHDQDQDDQDDQDDPAALQHGLHDLAGAATGAGTGSPYGQLGLPGSTGSTGSAGSDSEPDQTATAARGDVTLKVTAFDHGDAQLLASTAMITPDVLARICCEADLNVATLTATGELVNLGRTSRHPNLHQRRATVLRDQHCVFPGCDTPPARCQVHHLKFWTRDHGPTDLHNLALVCWFHHRLVHEDHWTLTPAPPTPHHPAGSWHATAPNGHQLRQWRQQTA